MFPYDCNSLTNVEYEWIELYWCFMFHVTRTIIRQLNWNLICLQLLWEIKTNWTIQTTLGLIKYEGQNWGAKIEGKKLRGKNWLYAPWLILQSNLFFVDQKNNTCLFSINPFSFLTARWLQHFSGQQEQNERSFFTTMYKNGWVVLKISKFPK